MTPRSRKTQEKKKTKRTRRARKSATGRAKAFLWWLVGICTATVLVMVFVLSDHGLYQLWQLKREQHLIQDRIQVLEQENANLAQQRDRLQNDMDYIEKLARERYRMAKPGEKVFRVLPQESGDSE